MWKALLVVLAGLATFLVVGVGVSRVVDRDSSPSPSASLNINGDEGQPSVSADENAVPQPAGVPAPDASLVPGSTSGGGGGAAGVGGQASGGGGPAPLPLPQLADRKIIRTATLELTVEDVAGAVQEVESAALGAGGFVAGSSLTIENPPAPATPDEEPPPQRQRASVTIRVPAAAYAGVMAHLRVIAKEVRSESSDASEVTEEYTDLQARLRNLEATEQRYLDLLTRAETIPDILTVQDRLNSVRLETEQVKGRIQLLDDLTDLATITVQLNLPPIAIQQEPQELQPGWAEEAWDNAWNASEDVLQALGTAAITGGVVAAWLIVPGLALLLGWRFLVHGRERKEAA